MSLIKCQMSSACKFSLHQGNRLSCPVVRFWFIYYQLSLKLYLRNDRHLIWTTHWSKLFYKYTQYKMSVAKRRMFRYMSGVSPPPPPPRTRLGMITSGGTSGWRMLRTRWGTTDYGDVAMWWGGVRTAWSGLSWGWESRVGEAEVDRRRSGNTW